MGLRRDLWFAYARKEHLAERRENRVSKCSSVRSPEPRLPQLCGNGLGMGDKQKEMEYRETVGTKTSLRRVKQTRVGIGFPPFENRGWRDLLHDQDLGLVDGETLHLGAVAIVAKRHGGRRDEGDAALRSHELLFSGGQVVAVQGVHGAGRELVGALGEDVVQRLAAAPDLDADVPAGGDHDAQRLLRRVRRGPLRAARLEQRAHDARVPIHRPAAELVHLLRHRDGLDELGVVLDDALAVAVVGAVSSAVCEKRYC